MKATRDPKWFEWISAARSINVKLNQKVVLYALASRASPSGECHPSHDRLCHDTGLRKRTLQRLLAKLSNASLIRVENGAVPINRGGRTWYLNRYTLTDKLLEQAAKDESDFIEGRTKSTRPVDKMLETGGQNEGGRVDTAMSHKQPKEDPDTEQPDKHIKNTDKRYLHIDGIGYVEKRKLIDPKILSGFGLSQDSGVSSEQSLRGAGSLS